MQRTLIIIKPDALQRSIVGEIITRFEKKGLKLIANKMVTLTAEVLKEHYAHLVDKPFFPGVESFMMSSPVILQIWEGYECIEAVRKMCGVTNSREAEPGSIRGDMSCSYGSNLIHASDSPEAADAEVKLFFSADEIFDYRKVIEEYSYSDEERS